MSYRSNSSLLNVVKKRIIKKRISFASLIIASFYSAWSIGATFELPANGSRVVGRIQHHEVMAGETLALIAKQYDIGFLSLMLPIKALILSYLPKVMF